jgi:hypothetical protein
MPTVVPGYTILPEPALSFHPERRGDIDIHPLRGLLQFGPYSRLLMGRVDPIRVATIAPQGEQRRLFEFMRELNQRQRPQERLDYLPEWPGFEPVFRVRMTAAASGLHAELEADLDAQLKASERPQAVLADALSRALSVLGGRRSDFDVVFIYLPDRWESAFEGDDDDFDLHDFLKALAAMRDIPSQIVREGSALSYPCRASVMWRIGIALYVKAGGVPWKLARFDPETAHIGLSYALRVRADGVTQFVTCCSQVFDADGTGLEFVAYDTSDVVVFRENPYLSRTEMARVMARSLALYQRRHAGKSPRRLVVQKGTDFKPNEVDGCFDALESAAESIELVHVQQDSSWRGVQVDQPDRGSIGQASAFPPRRGTCLQLGSREILLWTQGSQLGIAPAGRNFYKEGRSIPAPLKLVRYAGHSPMTDPCHDVLGLSKMNWNNDSLYDRLPVTLGYAHVLARTVKRIESLPSRTYQFRFFM